MKLLDKILVAHDFSKSAENVVETAIGLAKVFNSKLYLIHVLPDEVENDKVKMLLDESAHKKLAETAEHIKSQGVDVGQVMLKFGSAYECVVRAAAKERVNLILIGSGGNLKDEKFPLGTTAGRIIQKSDLPVYVVKEDTPLEVKKILCPVDFSNHSRRALKNAITIARRFKAEMVILNVMELPGTTWFRAAAETEVKREDQRQQQKKRFDTFLEGINFADLSWRQEVREGAADQEILKALAEEEIDLLLMGTAGKTGLSLFVVGSVAVKVLRQVPCSFIALKSTDVIQLQLETMMQDLENHFQTAEQLLADGFFEESIEEFEKCITINSMHVPSYYGIAKVYERLNKPEKVQLFNDRGRDIMDRIWNMKIEEEIRRTYSK